MMDNIWIESLLNADSRNIKPVEHIEVYLSMGELLSSSSQPFMQDHSLTNKENVHAG